jgi:predicted NAD-dependent protein-ADP-ribosyltransferase YbiA (DUF1768 family)
MVYSNLNSVVFYKEQQNIDPEDVGHVATLYEMDLLDKKVLIVLGKAKYSFSERNLIFYPVYLVSNQKVVQCQIGIVEIPKNRVIDFLDEDGEIDVSKVSPPILFGFVNDVFVDRSGSNAEEYLRKTEKPTAVGDSGKEDKNNKEKDEENEDENEDEDKDNKEKQVSDEEDDDDDDVMKVKVSKSNLSKEVEKASEVLKVGVFSVDAHVISPRPLSEEGEKEAKDNRKNYKSGPRNNWIEKFMKNNNYEIHDVEANGDCFFAVVRDAFKQIGQITTVSKLRAILAKEVTDDVFQEHRKLFIELDSTVREYAKEMNDIKNTLQNVLKKRAEKARDDKAALQQIMKETEHAKSEFLELQKKKKGAEEIISESLGNFGEIDTLENFRQHVQSSAFWADAWAISVLERVLRIKLIILSERAYLEGDLDGVMNCGEVDPDLQKQAKFEPKYYIMTTFSGDHYKLITYKDKRILEFQEIPYDIKALVLNKCLEKSAGAFYIVPEFRQLKSKMGIPEDEGASTSPDEEDITDEYDNKTVFEFSQTSAYTPKPGKGKNEKIPLDRRSQFVDLGRIKDWRKKLDDSWTEALFVLDGHKWASVEHYYQGAKFRKQNPEFSILFSLDSAEENLIARDVEVARIAGSKSGRATGKMKQKIKEGMDIRPTNVTIDPDFYGQRSEDERLKALRAKFTLHPEMTHLLRSTKNAKLVHFVRRAEAETDHLLMKVRKEL